MPNYCTNKLIITHDDRNKLKDLYRISAEDFFTFVCPPPVELCNQETLEDSHYNLEEFGADNLQDWKIRNWGTASSAIMYLDDRYLSQNCSYLVISFDTHWHPPIGIYKALGSLGYRVKAYYWERDYGQFCGSFIYGELEHFNYSKGDVDIPPDINAMFPIKEYVEYMENPNVPESNIFAQSASLTFEDEKEELEELVLLECDLDFFTNQGSAAPRMPLAYNYDRITWSDQR